MKTSLKLVTLGVLAYGALINQQASAQIPGPSRVPDVSSGSILQSNPILNAPVEPRAKDSPKIDARRPTTTDTAADEPRMPVARIEVDEVPENLKPQVDALVAPYRDREMTLSELRNVAIQITGILLDNGETISYAYVPQQDIVDDVVHLRVLRGHVESIELKKNDSLVRDWVLRAYLARGLSASGHVKAAQDQLTRLADLPGVGAITPTLSPGQTPGGTVLSVDTKPSPRFEGTVVLDNAGSRSTGRNRMGVQATINSPLGLGDRLQLVAFGSPDYFQLTSDSNGGHTWIGRFSYDMPIDARGARAGVAISRVNYLIGGNGYAASGNNDFNGYATVYSVYGSSPLVRSARQNLNFTATFDYKRMSDSEGDNDDRNVRSSQLITLQLSGDRQGRLIGLPNVFQYSVGVTNGRLDNKGGWYFNGAKTRGTFTKTTQSAQLLQGLYPGVYLNLSVNAQQASTNLDPSEKMSLGGANAVRAYSNDTTSVDSGYIASAALNVTVPKVNGMTAQVFFDRAHGITPKFASYRNKVAIQGWGVGLNQTFGKRASVNLTYAQRIGNDRRAGPQHKSMVWASTAIRF
jgi:hemolysin activation/secretion protein